MELYSKLAEHNGPAIERTLKAMFGDIQRIDVNYIEEMKSDLMASKGLYVFFVRVVGGFSDYPIYVGYTGNNFYDRLRQHRVRNAVGIRGIKYSDDDLRQIGEHQLFVDVFPCNAGAKTLESLFLKAFDFALNSEENERVRDILDLSERNNVIKSKYILQQAWAKTKQDVLDFMQILEKMEKAIKFLE